MTRKIRAPTKRKTGRAVTSDRQEGSIEQYHAEFSVERAKRYQDRITELLLGEFSVQEIRGLHPKAERILNRLINREYDKHGISRMTPEMFGGFREVMNELWSPGLTTVLNTLSKRHNE
jgi:hypothetical protein